MLRAGYTEIQNQDPHKSLIVALIERSILDLKNYDHKIRKDAQIWFASHNSKAFSFCWCIRMLGIIHLEIDLRKKIQSLIKQIEVQKEIFTESPKSYINIEELFSILDGSP